MAIEKVNKFETAAAELDQEETAAKEKSEKVIKKIAGQDENTRMITDRNGRKRRVKVKEERKTFPVYVPMSLYKKFDEITTMYGISNNAAICQMIRDYVTDKEEILY